MSYYLLLVPYAYGGRDLVGRQKSAATVSRPHTANCDQGFLSPFCRGIGHSERNIATSLVITSIIELQAAGFLEPNRTAKHRPYLYVPIQGPGLTGTLLTAQTIGDPRSTLIVDPTPEEFTTLVQPQFAPPTGLPTFATSHRIHNVSLIFSGRPVHHLAAWLLHRSPGARTRVLPAVRPEHHPTSTWLSSTTPPPPRASLWTGNLRASAARPPASTMMEPKLRPRPAEKSRTCPPCPRPFTTSTPPPSARASVTTLTSIRVARDSSLTSRVDGRLTSTSNVSFTAQPCPCPRTHKLTDTRASHQCAARHAHPAVARG